MNKRDWARHAVFLSALSAFYGALALTGIRTQGLYFDIALLGDCALGLYKGLPWDPGLSIHLLGRNIVLMVDAYHGAQEAFLALPWIYLFKNTSLALNLASVWLGYLALLALYWTASVLFEDALAACGASLLLATSPSFIAGSRLGLWVGMATCAAAVAGLGCLLKWRRTGAPAWGVLAAALLGFGLGCRVQFLWFIAALALSVALLDLRSLTKAPARAWLSWSGAATIGLLPQVIVNVKSRFMTLRYLAGYVFDSKSGVDNLAFARNLEVRLGHLANLIGGASFFNSSRGVDPVALAAALAALLLAGILVVRRLRRSQPLPKRIILPWLLMLIMLAESTATPDFMDVHHLIMLLPFSCLAVAGTVAAALAQARGRLARVFLAGVLAAPILSQGWRLYEERPWTQLHGGWEVRWDMVQELSTALRGRGIASVGLGDTGIMDPLTYLSGGDIVIDEIFWAPYRTDTTLQAVRDRLQRRLRAERTGYYVFRTPEAARVTFLSEFLSQVRAAGKRARVLETVATPDGHPLFVIYQVG